MRRNPLIHYRQEGGGVPLGYNPATYTPFAARSTVAATPSLYGVGYGGGGNFQLPPTQPIPQPIPQPMPQPQPLPYDPNMVGGGGLGSGPGGDIFNGIGAQPQPYPNDPPPGGYNNNDGNPNNDSGNAGWGFTSFKDLFDGGGPGASGDSFTGGIHGDKTVGDATDGWQLSDLIDTGPNSKYGTAGNRTPEQQAAVDAFGADPTAIGANTADKGSRSVRATRQAELRAEAGFSESAEDVAKWRGLTYPEKEAAIEKYKTNQEHLAARAASGADDDQTAQAQAAYQEGIRSADQNKYAEYADKVGVEEAARAAAQAGSTFDQALYESDRAAQPAPGTGGSGVQQGINPQLQQQAQMYLQQGYPAEQVKQWMMSMMPQTQMHGYNNGGLVDYMNVGGMAPQGPAMAPPGAPQMDPMGANMAPMPPAGPEMQQMQPPMEPAAPVAPPMPKTFAEKVMEAKMAIQGSRTPVPVMPELQAPMMDPMMGQMDAQGQGPVMIHPEAGGAAPGMVGPDMGPDTFDAQLEEGSMVMNPEASEMYADELQGYYNGGMI